MQRELSLLGRLQSRANGYLPTTELDIGKLLLDISDNIQDMLNVRLGTVLALDDYGMPDFNDVVKDFPDAITRIQTAIREFIERYEPRLAKIQVQYLEDPEQPLVLKFAIIGQLRGQPDEGNVRFSTVLTGSGRATVNV